MRSRTWIGWAVAAVAAWLSVGCGYGPPSEAGACPFAGACTDGGAASGSAAVVETGFSRAGTGDAVVHLPATATAVRVTGETDAVAEAFSVHAQERLLLNAVLHAGGPTARVQGTYLVAAGAQLSLKGPLARWTVTAVLVMPAPDTLPFQAAGRGAAVLIMPQRAASYTVTASTAEVAEAFAVWVGDRLAANVVIGAQGERAVYSGALTVPAGATVRIDGEFADWRIVEGG